MKRKKIEYIINHKFNDWVNSITDETVREKVAQNTICTGGAICSLYLNEKINDFDFYFADKDTAKVVAEYYVKKFTESNSIKSSVKPIKLSVVENQDGRINIKIQSAGIAGTDSNKNEYGYFEYSSDDGSESQEYVSNIKNSKSDVPYSPIFMSSNAITLSNDIQLIIRFYGNPTQIHDTFDFVHCTNYWSSDDKKIHTNENALECILTKELKYIGSKYPIASLFRIRKFIKRGWHISAGQILKIAMQVNELNLKNIDVLYDQLVGVDVAYFNELINKLKSKNPDSVDSTYLVQLIDEIF
jgi:hypothetical protein